MAFTWYSLFIFVAMAYVIMTQEIPQAAKEEMACPSCKIQQELNICHRIVSSALRYPDTDPSCFSDGYNQCLCGVLNDTVSCFIDLWDACEEDPAFSGLGWTCERYMNYMFFRVVKNSCPLDKFFEWVLLVFETTTEAGTTEVLSTEASATGPSV